MSGLGHAVHLAIRHLRHHAGRSLLIVLALSLVGFLPIAVDGVVDAGGRALRARAADTPLVAGASGAPIDLVLAALYFRKPPDRTMTLGSLEGLAADDLGTVLPIVMGDRVKKSPLVGVDPGYLDFRELRLGEGRWFAVAGECVLGAEVARREGLSIDDRITTEPREMFDLAGAYPLRMRVVGVLEPSGSADDGVVFVSPATAWIVQGLAHGHDRVEDETDPSLVMGRTDDVVVASAKVREFVEITDENRGSFHFHGARENRPVTAAIIVPRDARSETILMGRADAGLLPVQLVRASEVVDRLLVEVFRIRRILLAVLGVVAVATLLLVLVVLALSVRIRAVEIETMQLIGASRFRVGLILGSEIVILIGFSLLLAAMGGMVLAGAIPMVENLLLG